MVFNKDKVDNNADIAAKDLNIAMHTGNLTEVIKELSSNTKAGLNDPKSINEFTSRLDRDIQSDSYLKSCGFPAGAQILDDLKQRQLVNVARTAIGAGYSAEEAIAVEDNSAAMTKMFPGDQAKSDAAYRIVMHYQGFSIYENLCQDDLGMFSSVQLAKIRDYSEHYKPSIAPAAVDAEISKEEQPLTRKNGKD